MTLAGHFLDDLRARAFVDSVSSLAGMAWGKPSTRAELARRLAPYDSLERAEQMLSAQSNCAIVGCAGLLEAGVDGTVTGWRGKPVCDPLREPRWGHYDAIMFVQHLARQRGAWQTPQLGQRPEIPPGSLVLIGGPDGGGASHIVCVTGVRDDGTFDAVEGGKLDAGNPRKSPENCTAVEHDHRRVYEMPGGSWWMGDASPPKPGRRIVGWCWVGALPGVST